MSSGITIVLTPTSPPVANVDVTAHMPRTTSFDLVERMLNALGGQSSDPTYADFKTAIRDALREFQAIHRWQYFIGFTRIQVNAPYDTGTITYDYTGGAYERLLTLADGTWPTWARFGFVRIANIVYQVQSRIDDTRLQLDPLFCPIADIASGTEYDLTRNIYTLPMDMASIDRGLIESSWTGMTYIRPQDFLANSRYLGTDGSPRQYTFMGDPKLPGRMALGLYPSPDADSTLDFSYHRRMREIQTFDSHAGLATVSSPLSTITLSGGTFTQAYVGSVIRLGTTKDVPTRIEGKTPYTDERTITQVVNSTTAYVDQDFSSTYAGVGYRISDPIDIEDPTMMNAFLACAMKFLGRIRRFDAKQQQQLEAAWANTLDIAKELDDHDSSVTSVDLWGLYRMRLRDMPRGPDVS